MALYLVVTSPFPGYTRGTIITNSTTITAIRNSEYASQVVLVSDTVVVPPSPPDGTPLPGGGVSNADYLALKTLYDNLAASDVQQQSALAAILSVNTSQTNSLNSLGQQLSTLNTTVQALAAKVDNPTGGNPIPANLADDLPLAENDGLVLATESGAVLVGDIR